MSLYYTGYSANPADPRPPACAGGWYPADRDDLDKLVTKLLAAAPEPSLPGAPACLIVPHAGYRFSGATAAAGFKAVEGKSFSRVVLLGPSHTMGGFAGGAVPTVKAFATPLGEIPLDRDACEKLIKARYFTADDRPHEREHCLEMELPLLQKAVKGPRIVPVVIGNATNQSVVEMAAGLRTILDEKTLLVISTDFTHYGPNYHYVPFKDRVAERLRDLDGAAIDRILAVDRLGFVDLVAQTGATICGRWPVALALEALGGADVEGVALAYTTSGALTKDYTNSVSYAAIALCRGAAAPLTADEQHVLLALARDQVRRYLADGKGLEGVREKYKITPRLAKPAPAFVTLKNDGRLRGCIGHVTPVCPLYESVLTNAISACKDPRFVTDRVTAAEEPKLDIEISVLSRYRMVAAGKEIQVGRDGLILRRGRSQGLLLPQVPVEQKWDLGQYLTALCRKAGVPASALKDPQTRLYRFTAQVFGEKDHADAGAP